MSHCHVKHSLEWCLKPEYNALLLTARLRTREERKKQNGLIILENKFNTKGNKNALDSVCWGGRNNFQGLVVTGMKGFVIQFGSHCLHQLIPHVGFSSLSLKKTPLKVSFLERDGLSTQNHLFYYMLKSLYSKVMFSTFFKMIQQNQIIHIYLHTYLYM